MVESKKGQPQFEAELDLIKGTAVMRPLGPVRELVERVGGAFRRSLVKEQLPVIPVQLVGDYEAVASYARAGLMESFGGGKVSDRLGQKYDEGALIPPPDSLVNLLQCKDIPNLEKLALRITKDYADPNIWNNPKERINYANNVQIQLGKLQQGL